MSKLKRQVMQALEIKTSDIQRQTEPNYNLYKVSLDDILDSNINDIVANISNINSCLLKQTILDIQLEIFFHISLLLALFSKITNSRNKNSNLFAKKIISFTLPPSIVPRALSNLLFRPSCNYDKMKKRKPRTILISYGLDDLSYIKDQSISQNVFL